MLDKVKPEASVEEVIKRFESVRKLTESLCRTLEVEDYNLQAMPETSPAKWHLAHTSWFFETFILKDFDDNFEPYHPEFEHLFNSYYNAVGKQYPRPQRHLLSRPTVDEVYRYRQAITQQICELLIRSNIDVINQILPLVILGIHHEQQHQELLLTDLKYNLYQNPLFPAYNPESNNKADDLSQSTEHQWIKYEAGLCSVGVNLGDVEFAFDNESPQHRHYLEGFQLGSRLVTNNEFIEFIEGAGYERSELWLSDGWSAKNEHGWLAPLYWFKQNDTWYHYTLNGVKKVQGDQPVSHVSYYEADAYASWKDARLPTEQEWERAAQEQSLEGSFLDSGHLSAIADQEKTPLSQLYGELWQWTSSSYSPYPGYEALPGAVGEYNGKFMVNQYVLRGGSCVSSQDHLRATYRNFFYPDARWQFSGIRLAKNL